MPTHILRISFLAALPLFLIACSSADHGPDNTSGTGAGGRGGGRGAGVPVPVVISRAEQKAVPVTIPAVGTVEAISSVQIRSQVTGQLSAVHFAEGHEVRKGQPLFSLDPRPFQAALQQAQAVLARDTATLENARTQHTRSESLFQRGLIPREQYESQRAGMAALAATVEADQAVVENARLNVQYAEITAPVSGRTGSLGVHAGDMVRANDTTPLVDINQLSPVYVTFSVPARFLSDIRRYQARNPLSVTAAEPRTSRSTVPARNGGGPSGAVTRAALAAAATPGGPARGVVTFIDNAVDSTTGTIRLKATCSNADRALWPGAFVEVTLDLTTERDAVVVPAVAVQTSQDGQYVFVVTAERTVEMRAVKVARQQGNEAVIAEGVSPGEEVVTDGHLRLTPGARVTARGEAGKGSESPGGGGPSPAGGGNGRVGGAGTLR
jgi:multidrug efflux system membrane fusion protein